jgi:hypothetical protein
LARDAAVPATRLCGRVLAVVGRGLTRLFARQNALDLDGVAALPITRRASGV